MEWTETHYTCLNTQVHSDTGKKEPPLGVTDETKQVIASKREKAWWTREMRGRVFALKLSG